MRRKAISGDKFKEKKRGRANGSLVVYQAKLTLLMFCSVLLEVLSDSKVGHAKCFFSVESFLFFLSLVCDCRVDCLDVARV